MPMVNRKREWRGNLVLALWHERDGTQVPFTCLVPGPRRQQSSSVLPPWPEITLSPGPRTCPLSIRLKAGSGVSRLLEKPFRGPSWRPLTLYSLAIHELLSSLLPGRRTEGSFSLP